MSALAQTMLQPRISPAWWGLLLVLPSTLFWACLTISIAPGMHRMADPWLALVNRYDLWFVVGVLMLLPFVGSLLGAAGYKRSKWLSIAVVFLGLGAVCLNLLMQSANPSPAI
ncbi:hypothetical protein IT575_06025 [bacterium]|nr:hypothetical protein [bacterium]